MKDLVQSKVVFDEVKHTYKLGRKTLSGITSVIGYYICPNKYDGIDPEVLRKAAEIGSEYHKQVQMWVDGMPCAEMYPEVAEFIEANGGLESPEFCASEFLVSDNKHFASSIDIIDKEGNLYDIKTTSSLDKKYLSWQLSIYRYLFKMQCGWEPEKLFAIHFDKKGRWKKVEVTPISERRVKALLDQASIGAETFDDPEEFEKNIDADVTYAELAELKRQSDEINIKIEALKSRVMENLKEKGESVRYGGYQFIYKAASKTQRFDSTSFKKECPEEYSKYLKESEVKESITIKALEK